MSQAVVICEGYHDRAFWTGLLKQSQCRSFEPGGTDADPWGETVGKGQFGFAAPTGGFVRVVPARGDWRTITRSARAFLVDRERRPLRHLVLCRDADVDEDQPIIYPTAASIADALRTEVADLPAGPPGAMQLADGTPVSVVLWQAGDASAPGLPTKQTLERLACAALLAAYPERGLAIADWLASRHDAPPDSPKA